MGNDILSIKFARTTLTFQSTFPRGERRKTIDNVKAEEKFQSTFPRGERQGVSLTALISGNFNPRSRVGNDVQGIKRITDRLHFNPRSRVGNDYDNTFQSTDSKQFQSTFPRGERRVISV